MRGREVLVAAALSLSCACSGSTVGQIGKSDPGRRHRDAGSSGGSASTISEGGPVQDGSGGGLSLTPRDTGADADTCVATVQAGERIPVDVLMLVERSDATEELIPGTTTSWWTATTAGIRTFLENPNVSVSQAGLKMFPVAEADGATACQADYATPDVGIGPLSGSAVQVIESQLAARAPGSGRPTGPALEGAVAYLQTRATVEFAGRMQSVALITRGEPDRCSPSTIAELKSYLGAIEGAPVPSAVSTIALGASAQNMVGVGQGDPEFFYIPGGDVAEAVRDALLRVLFPFPPGCSIRLPQAPPGQLLDIDLDKIIVTIDSFVAGYEEVPRVLSAADCDRTGGRGWYVGTADAAPTVEFCHATCSDLPADIHMLFGCAPRPVP